MHESNGIDPVELGLTHAYRKTEVHAETMERQNRIGGIRV